MKNKKMLLLILEPEFERCRLQLIQSISEKVLGAAVCMELLRKNVVFKTINSDSEPLNEDVVLFLVGYNIFPPDIEPKVLN